MHYKLAQLLLTPGPKSNSSSEVFIAQPDSNKENLSGKLFVLIEIESRSPNCAKFINFLISEINRNYYQNEKLILRERVSTIKIEDVFESALAKTNKNIGEYFQNQGNYLDLSIINATVGVIFENQLHFSLLGKNRAFLIYQNKNAQETSKYKINEVTSGATHEDETKPANAQKLFINVVNGSIPENGYFIFSNETLPEYLSFSQMIEITTALPPISAVEQMKNLLSHVNSYVSFSGIVIKNTFGLNISEPERAVARTSAITQASINNLKITEERTEKLLTPSGLIDFEKWFSKLSSFVSLPHLSGGRLPGSGKILMTEKMSFKKRTGFKYLKNISEMMRSLFSYLISFILYLPKIINKGNVAKLISGLKDPAAKLTAIKIWFDKFSKKQKILMFASIILIFLFFLNSISLNQKNKEKTQQQSYKETAQKIEQKQNVIESNLIYGNLNGAYQQLSEIKDLLERLPKDDARYMSYFEKYRQQLAKISREVIVEPIELANFNNLNSNSRPKNISLANNKIFAADSDNKAIYVLDLKDKSATALNDLPQPVNSLEYPSKDKDLIYYFNGNSLLSLDPKDESIKRYSLSSPEVKGMIYYNNKLYLLNPAENQIYRLTKSGDSFINSTPWVKNNSVIIKDATSFAIDSSIYVLKNNGQVLKLLRGAEESFALDKITPSLETAAKIAVEEKNIYILDINNKRLAVFDKNGKLVSQYKSEKLDDLKDFTVDEAGKKAYLLNGSTVQQINL